MVDEVLLPGEALAAVGAGVRRDARVLADVVVEVLLASERARTVRALVWRFTRVLSAQQSTFRFHQHANQCYYCAGLILYHVPTKRSIFVIDYGTYIHFSY